MPLQTQSLDENRAEYAPHRCVPGAQHGYSLYNGGGDSADPLKVSQISAQMGYPIQAIHVPKTIDNDLPLNVNCPGFGSVAKYVAISTKEAALDIESMCNVNQVFILEVMGRHAGWIAGASALASTQQGDALHVILFPEIAFDQQRFLDKVAQSVDRYGYALSPPRRAPAQQTVDYCLIRASGMPSDTRN